MLIVHVEKYFFDPDKFLHESFINSLLCLLPPHTLSQPKRKQNRLVRAENDLAKFPLSISLFLFACHLLFVSLSNSFYITLSLHTNAEFSLRMLVLGVGFTHNCWCWIFRDGKFFKKSFKCCQLKTGDQNLSLWTNGWPLGWPLGWLWFWQFASG